MLDCFSLATLVTMAALAQPELTVTGCSSAEAFTQALDSLVGEEVVDASTATVRVAATSTDGGWTTTLEISGDRPMLRTLVAESCEAGMEAAVVVAAMALDPEMLLSGATEEEWMRERPRPVPAPPPKPEPPPEPDPEPVQPSPPPRDPVRWEFEVGVGGSLGTLPRASGLVRAATGVRWDWLSVRAGVSYAWPHTIDVNTTASARLQMWAAAASLCYVAELGERWDAPLCLTAHLGRMQGRGSGEGVEARQGSTTWGAAGLGGNVRWWATRHLGLYAGFEGLGVFARPDFVIENKGQACCSSPVVLSGSLGPAFRL